MAKLFSSVKGKQTVKVESFRYVFYKLALILESMPGWSISNSFLNYPKAWSMECGGCGHDV